MMKKGKMLSAALQNSAGVLPSVCAWKRFLGESTEIVKYNKCEGEYDVKKLLTGNVCCEFLGYKMGCGP